MEKGIPDDEALGSWKFDDLANEDKDAVFGLALFILRGIEEALG